MCARMVWVYDESKGLWVRRIVYTPEAEWELEGVEELRPPATYYNVTPTYQCALLQVAGTKLRLTRARWGVEGVGGMGHNAKVENLGRVPAWRQLWGSSHGVVVCDGFYEWDTSAGRKQPYFIRRRDGWPMALAALVRPSPGGDPTERSSLPQVTVITCPANDLVGRLHDRMPVVLEAKDVRRHLQRDSDKDLLRPAGDVLEMHPVSTDVNKSTNSRPDLLDPIDVKGGTQGRLF